MYPLTKYYATLALCHLKTSCDKMKYANMIDIFAYFKLG